MEIINDVIFYDDFYKIDFSEYDIKKLKSLGCYVKFDSEVGKVSVNYNDITFFKIKDDYFLLEHDYIFDYDNDDNRDILYYKLDQLEELITYLNRLNGRNK